MATNDSPVSTADAENASNAANAWEEALIADVRANGGRPSDGPLKGHPIMLVWTTGAKSGQPRRSILTWSRQDGDYFVAGTAGGSPTTPAWVMNIRKDPHVTVEAEGRTFETTATVVGEDERPARWAEHVAQLPWFADYPNQVGERTIPVIRIEAPRES